MGYWLINTAGIGGFVVVGVFLALMVVYARLVRWVLDGGKVEAEGDAHQ